MALRKPLLMLGLVLALAGCQLGRGPSEPATVGAAGLQAPAVSVQSLDDPGASSGPQDARIAEDSEAAAPPEPPAATAAPVAAKTAAHLACEKRGGSYVTVSTGGAFTCQFSTKDAGKSCSKSGDCEGVCLARSRSCAPINPLFGCNEVLQDDGRRMSLCIE
jgi:hypothetical protein